MESNILTRQQNNTRTLLSTSKMHAALKRDEWKQTNKQTGALYVCRSYLRFKIQKRYLFVKTVSRKQKRFINVNLPPTLFPVIIPKILGWGTKTQNIFKTYISSEFISLTSLWNEFQSPENISNYTHTQMETRLRNSLCSSLWGGCSLVGRAVVLQPQGSRSNPN